MNVHDLVETVRALWPQALIAGAIMLAGTGAGWQAARRAQGWHVRLVRRWIDRVVQLLLADGSGARRTAVIALNNITVCAALTATGVWGPLAWIGVAGVGFALGIGLRLLLAHHAFPDEDAAPPRGWRRLAAGIGLAVNLLEPPAILLAGALALGQEALWPGLSAATTWCIFACVVAPLLVLAAAGESLWIGILRPAPCQSGTGSPDPASRPQSHPADPSPIDREPPTWQDTP